jgi:hypothetical protein
MASSRSGSSLWVLAWLRAVALPAWRRTGAVWGALAIIAAIVMGPTGLMPRDVVDLLMHAPAAPLMLGALWTALLHPSARLLVRAEAAAYLRTLPTPTVAAALPLVNLAAMQLPPLALFLGGGRPGWGVVGWAALTATSYALAHLRWPRRRLREPRWSGGLSALSAVLASRLLADDALLRGVAFAGLGGAGASLMIRNNQLLGGGASTLGLGTVIILGTPAWAAVTQPLALAHRRLWPLCAATGLPAASWVSAQALVLGATMTALFGFAALIAGGLGGLNLVDVARIVGGGLLLGAAAGMAAVRVGEWATRSRHVAERTVTGSLLVSAVLALLLGFFGEVALLAGPALAVAALARTREPVMP